MSRFLYCGLLALVGLTVGCNTEPTATIDSKIAPVAGPHGGIAYPLPGDSGYAEVVLERAKVPGKVALLVYFLKADLKAPLATPPTDVSATVVTPEKAEPLAVILTLKPVAKDPLATARFASEPGPYDFDEIRGDLIATVDGKPFQAAFAFR